MQKHVGCKRHHLAVDTTRNEIREGKKESNMSRNPIAGHGEEYQEDIWEQKYMKKQGLTSSSGRQELKETVNTRRAEYSRISVERKNRSYDESYSKHTCSLAMDRENHKHSCYTGRTKNRDNRNVKLYMDDTSLLYGAKLHRQFSLQ